VIGETLFCLQHIFALLGQQQRQRGVNALLVAPDGRDVLGFALFR